jgi:regulator of sigma E protease
MSVIFSVFSFLFVIAVLIAVHEWGHYRMATLVGVRVIRFSLGFGKPLFKWTPKRQPLLDGHPQTTEFVIAALPFGGYVKMQDEREPDQRTLLIVSLCGQGLPSFLQGRWQISFWQLVSLQL